MALVLAPELLFDCLVKVGNEAAQPDDILHSAIHPAPRHLLATDALHLLLRIHEGLLVDLALPLDALAEQECGRIFFRKRRRQVEVEEYPVAEFLITANCGEVGAAEQQLVCAARHPEEMGFLQGDIFWVVFEARDDRCHEGQEWRDAHASAHRHEHLPSQGTLSRGHEGSIQGNPGQLSDALLIVEHALRQMPCPVSDA
mmetsp:Transcript_13562/g.29837  ORF Transcript_13562/g.29837 Transcript_13562/m.29837 type:complete len:200 (+) Transcript_13562:602-1201(+)